MITQENEFYLRFILLLIQGGTEVLREIAAKALQKCNTTLDQFLSKNASAIQKSRDLTKKQKDILYPVSQTAVSDIRHYDITLLSYLITNFLTGSLESNESNAVYKIRQMRNDYHAHTNEAKMNLSTFSKEWSTLMNIMFTISHNLPEEKRVNLTKIMDSIQNEQLDIKVVIDEIKKLDQSNEYLNVLQSIQMSVDDLSQTVTAAYSNLQKDILEIKLRLENQGKNTKVVNTVRGKIVLNADEQETIDYAENLLLEASKDSVEKSTNENNKKLKEPVDKFVEDIEELDIKVEKVCKGSIVFEFVCFSLSALLDLIDYFNSVRFQERLHEIAAALEDRVGKKINVSGILEFQSIQDVITNMQEKKYEKVVNFEMECTGVDGLLHALEIFEGGKAANSLNELSTALSESVGKPVTLHTSIDIEQMQQAINSIREELDRSNTDYLESSETCVEPESSIELDDGTNTKCETEMKVTNKVVDTISSGKCLDQGRSNQERGGEKQGEDANRVGHGQGQPGGQSQGPMKQGGRNQGPVNQGHSGPINQRDANQEPMNQRDANQGPMNQRGLNQGPVNQRGPNKGHASQRGERYQQTSNQGFHNQGQYGNSDEGYRDGYGNQGPQDQRRGNPGFSTPPSIYGGPPPLMGQQYVQHEIQPYVMPLYQVPFPQPPPLFPPPYNFQQNNFNNEPYCEPYQQQENESRQSDYQEYESRQSDYGKRDKGNMQRSSSQQSVDSVGRQSDNYEPGKRGGHRGRGGNPRGRNIRRGNMDKSASTMNVNNIGRGKQNDIQSSKNCGSDASDEFDDNISVVSEMSMRSLSIADEASYQSVEEKKERREKKSSSSETYKKSAMVDENEVFKFLVKKLDGHGTPEEIKRKSGLFPAEFNEMSWFKIHRRRFLVLGENDSNCIVVAFYKQATYCKFYITSRSCQKDCGRYHICKNLLLGHCKFGGEKCKFSHDFLDERNFKVSKELGFSNVFTSDEICSLMKVRFPHVCQNWAETGSCSMPDCIGLHLCPRYLLGKCLEGKDCPLLHDKTSPHNKPIIEAYGMSDWQESMFRQMVYISRESTNEGDDHSNDKEEAVTGATSDVLYTQVPENSADSQVPGKKKLPKIEVVDIETSDEASKKYICEDYIIDKCRRPKCQKMHTCTKMPYLWQVNLFGKWTNLLQSEQVETEFCGYSDKSSGILERHNDIDMEIVVMFDKNQKAVVKILTTDDGAMICDWRRLSTLSYTQGDMNNEGFKTQWRWYWKDDHNRWNLFEPDSFQHTLERKFLAKQDVFYFSRENYRFKLKVDFEEMSQLNLETRKNRVLLRRPVFVSSGDVKNERFGCSLGAAPVVATKLPKGWVPWDLANPFELVMLDENSPDYNTVADSFYSTLRRTEQKIDSIYRMQNHKLWSLFCNQEKIMEANLKRVGRDCQVDTRYLFHGTDSLDAVRGISINNFDVRVSGKNATMYGDGAYFARDAKYSHSYTKPPERFMFMVKVLVGEYTKGDKSYRRPPQKPGSNHELFDSCVNDEANPSIFIVFDKNQYYPEYLIQYRNVNEVDSQQSAYVPSVPKPRPASRTPHSPTQSSQSFGNNANSGDTSISWYSPNASQQYPANPISYPSTYSTSSTASQQYPADPISYPSTSSIPSTANQQYTSNPTSFSSNTSSSASADKKYTYTAEPSKPKKKDESCSIQ